MGPKHFLWMDRNYHLLSVVSIAVRFMYMTLLAFFISITLYMYAIFEHYKLLIEEIDDRPNQSEPNGAIHAKNNLRKAIQSHVAARE